MSRNILWFIDHILAWVTLAHALLFIAYWLTNSLFYASTNDYLTNMLAKRRDYVSLLLVISAIIAAGSAALGLLSALRKDVRLPAATLWVYFLIALIYIIFFYGSFALLFRESPVQGVRLRQLIGYYRLVIDPVLFLGLALLVTFLVRNILGRTESVLGGRACQGSVFCERACQGSVFCERACQGSVFCERDWLFLALPALGFVILWALALAFPPSSVIRGSLPDKPRLIAHRGASMLAPENTLAAANRAVEIGVAGLETDVQVSQDGQLFLLHDGTFDRTTDIASVFPGRQNEPAGNFTMAEIKQLNAGEWFVEQDPYHTIRDDLVTSAQLQEYRQQPVPLFSDWVDIVRRNHLMFIFDLEQLPADNPHISQIFELAFQQLNQPDLRPLILFLVDEQQLRTLQQRAPDMVATYKPDYQSPLQASQVAALGYHLVNAEYRLSPCWIRQYQSAGLWVNIYTVDEPWQFSRLWILGVDSITTSNVGTMASLTRPILSLPFIRYLFLWTMVGLVGLTMYVGLIYPVLRR